MCHYLQNEEVGKVAIADKLVMVLIVDAISVGGRPEPIMLALF